MPDCYADPRFDPSTDRRTGYHTRCLLTLPLVDHAGVLVGVMQVLNKRAGVFDAEDEALATVLAAQCAVALQRVRMTEALLEGERLRQELELARAVQLATLPARLPAIPGYDLHGAFEPAAETGGDTYDLALHRQGLWVVLADAVGHGMGPALTVAQLQAMLRMAFRLGTGLEDAFAQVNNLLCDSLPPDRFITAFLGLLDPGTHRLRFHSAGQGPILLLRAATGEVEAHGPTSFPLAALPLETVPAAPALDLAPGDVLALLSDGFAESRDPEGAEFGQERVAAVLRAHQGGTMAGLAARLLAEVRAFSRGVPQEDDRTAVLVKRLAPLTARFPRRVEALPDLVAFVGAAFACLGLDAALRPDVEFAVEELFTNSVKYGQGGAEGLELALSAVPGGLEVALVDEGVARFDPASAPAVDVGRPLGERQPGRLGLHLVKKLVDSLSYEYDADRRRARTTFRKTRRAQEA